MKKAGVLKRSRLTASLPADIWLEIFSRLPVKTLLRFRCVSKSWLSMIDDPDFSFLHLNSFRNNCNETHLLVVQGRKRNQIVRSSNTFKTTVRLGFLESNHLCNYALTSRTIKSPERWDIICSINGLYMLRNSNQWQNLMLWNPSMRKSRLLPPMREESSYRMNYVDFGLGYVPSIGQYKYVRLAFRYVNLCYTGIYTIHSRSWKTVQFQGKRQSNWSWYLTTAMCRPVCFRSCLYIIARSASSAAQELVSFDLITESFDFTSLPDSSRRYELDGLILVDGGCSLALFDYNATEASMWVMESSGADNESISWTKRYTFPVRMDGFLYFTKNGDVLLGRTEVRAYNAETHKEKILLKNSHGPHIIQVYAYIECLMRP